MAWGSHKLTHGLEKPQVFRTRSQSSDRRGGRRPASLGALPFTKALPAGVSLGHHLWVSVPGHSGKDLSDPGLSLLLPSPEPCGPASQASTPALRGRRLKRHRQGHCRPGEGTGAVTLGRSLLHPLSRGDRALAGTPSNATSGLPLLGYFSFLTVRNCTVMARMARYLLTGSVPEHFLPVTKNNQG